MTYNNNGKYFSQLSKQQKHAFSLLVSKGGFRSEKHYFAFLLVKYGFIKKIWRIPYIKRIAPNYASFVGYYHIILTDKEINKCKAAFYLKENKKIEDLQRLGFEQKQAIECLKFNNRQIVWDRKKLAERRLKNEE